MRKPDGGWCLNSKALFDRKRLEELQTAYGEAMAPLGIRRGEPGSKAKHSEVRQFYGAIGKARILAARPTAPKPPTRPATPPENLRTAIFAALGIQSDKEAVAKRYEQERREWVQQMKAFKAEEEQCWYELAARAAVAPLKRRERGCRGASAEAASTPAVARRPRI